MRTAVVTLIAVGLATGAFAQETTPPATATATAPPAAPAASPATPQAAAPASAPAPAPPPVLPTTGDGAEVLSVLQKVCVPVVNGGSLDQLAPAAGLKKSRKTGGYSITMASGRDYTITVLPPGANPNVCQVELRYAVDQSQPIVTALNIWTILHVPELKPQRRDFSVDSENKRITTSWEYYTDKESTGLVFVELRRPDGGALNGKFDTATLQYSQRKF